MGSGGDRLGGHFCWEREGTDGVWWELMGEGVSVGSWWELLGAFGSFAFRLFSAFRLRQFPGQVLDFS